MSSAVSAPFGGFSALSMNYSIAFAGSNQFMNIGQPSDMNFDFDVDSYSGVVWAYIDNLSNQQCVLGKGPSGTADIAVFVGINTDGSAYLYLGGVSTSGSAGQVVAGTWNCFAFTASAGVGKLYLNGVQQGGNITIGTSQGTGSDWLAMATRYNDNTDFGFPVTGLCKMVAIWNVALNSGQVASLYNSGVPISPSTYFSTGLIHWWKMGDHGSDLHLGDDINDAVGSDNATLENITQGAMWAKYPGSSTPSFAHFVEDGNTDMHFRAVDYSGSGDWADHMGNFTGVRITGAGGTTKQASGISGADEVTQGDWFRCVDAAAHRYRGGSVSYAFRMYTGAEDGSGGFFGGFDNNGGSNNSLQFFNHDYYYDAGVWVKDPTTTLVDLSASPNHQPGKYITGHIVLFGTSAILFINGTEVAEVSFSSATLSDTTNSPFGILGVAYYSSGGYHSTASGQTIIEFCRWNATKSRRDVAVETAAWNVIKGYY